MAYKPPTQTRYASMTAPPPSGPFSGRGSSRSTEDKDGWITPVPRRHEPSPVAKMIGYTTSVGMKSSGPVMPKAEDFPTLGTSVAPKKTWGSTSTESMAERMKKRIQEEEEERIAKEKEKLCKEQETKENYSGEFVSHNIITHRSLMKRFKDEEYDENDTHNEYDYYHNVDDMECDGYGRQETYKPTIPDYHYVDNEDDNWEYDN